MNLKIVSKFFLFIIIVGFLSCQNNDKIEVKISSHNSDTLNRIKLKWLAQWYGEGKKETLLRELAREFCLLHQNIDIELEFPHEMAKIEAGDPSTSRYTIDTIGNMLKQNEWPYDIMLCDFYIYEMVGKNSLNTTWGKEYLVDFKDKPWFIDAHKDNFFNSGIETGIYNGIAPGAYIEGVWNVLYLSSVVENRLGIKVKNLDMGISDFISYAKAVFEYNKSHSDKITFISYPWDYVGNFFNQIAMSALGKAKADNREEAVKVIKQLYQEIEKLAQYKPLEQYVTYENSDKRTLYQDKVLFVYYPSWINVFWQKSNPEGEKMMHPCEIPSMDNKKAPFYSGGYNCVFVVPKNAKHSKEAELFMQFLSSQETADKWIKYSKCPTGLKNRISYSDFGTDEYIRFSNHIKQKYQDKLQGVSLNEVFFNSNKNLDFQIVKLMNGEISADEALKKLLKQL